MSARRRRVGLVLFVLAASWAASGVLAAWSLTRRARTAFAEPAPAGFVDVRLGAADGVGIGAWLAAPEEPRASVVLVHGNGTSRAACLDEARWFRARGCAVLPISARAHGDSDGAANDFGWSARLDVGAAVAYVAASFPERPVLVVGFSLGAAAALFAAAELDPALRALVLVAPYADLRDAVRRRTERYLPPLVDRLAYGALLLGSRLVLPELERIRPAAAAARIPADVRVLVFVGAEDDRAPLDDARRIALGHAARIVVVAHAGHAELERIAATSEWTSAVTELLDELAPLAR